MNEESYETNIVYHTTKLFITFLNVHLRFASTNRDHVSLYEESEEKYEDEENEE